MLRRAAELAQVLSALGQAGGMISVLVSGDAGIGKTTLLDEVCATLDARTLIVRATGGEGELDLPLAGITDLLKSLRPDVDRLDEPHRSMLAAAIERGEPAAPVVLGLAVMHLLDDVARRHPSVLLVIDDVQWFGELSALRTSPNSEEEMRDDLDGTRTPAVSATFPIDRNVVGVAVRSRAEAAGTQHFAGVRV